MLCAFALLAVPAGASAKSGCHGRTVSPHGNSEADQYTETIPGACGNHRPNPGNPAGSSSGAVPPNGAVPARTVARLESLGQAGRNAAALAQANAPAGTRGQASREGANPASAGEAGEDGGALSGVSKALGGGSGGGEGMGLALPLVLAGTLLAGLAYWLMRRRRAGPAS
jgi:hypothetical protein